MRYVVIVTTVSRASRKRKDMATMATRLRARCAHDNAYAEHFGLSTRPLPMQQHFQRMVEGACQIHASRSSNFSSTALRSDGGPLSMKRAPRACQSILVREQMNVTTLGST